MEARIIWSECWFCVSKFVHSKEPRNHEICFHEILPERYTWAMKLFIFRKAHERRCEYV